MTFMSRRMNCYRAPVLSFVLILLAVSGCDSKPAANPPAGSGQPVPANQKPTDVDPARPDTKSSPKTNGEPNSESPQSDGGTAPAVAVEIAKPNPIVPVQPPKPTDQQIAKWGPVANEPLQLLACYDGFQDPAAQCLAMTPDGKQFIVGGAKLTLWNSKESQPVIDLLENYDSNDVKRPIRSVAISPDGKWVAAGDQKGRIRVWTLNDQAEVASFLAHEGHITQIAFSPDSQRLATTSFSGEVRLWQMPDGKKLKSIKISDQEIPRIAFLSEQQLVVAGGETAIWNLESGARETALTEKHVIGPALGLSPDRTSIAFNDSDSLLQLWDVSNSRRSGLTIRGAGVHLIDFSSDRKWIATYSQDSNIRLWDVDSGRLIQVIDADGDITTGLKWFPEIHALLAVSLSGRVRIWGSTDSAGALGIEPIALPAVMSTPATAHRSRTSAEFRRIIDIRSFPRLPDAILQWGDYGICTYTAPATQKDAEKFYRYFLEKAGWMEVAPTVESTGGLVFRKEDCELNLTLAPAAAGGSGREGDLQVSLHFAGNYDVRWLPKIAPTDSKASWDSFLSVGYRTKTDITDLEVSLLKKFHEAGWTPYNRLAAASNEDPKTRNWTMLQGGSVLNVFVGHPADSKDELFVQTSVSVSNKSLPIPADSGWIEFDSSTDMQLVANTKMDLKQTIEFYDSQMASEGWLARQAGRTIKDDSAWLPYIRGQQDVLLRLSELPQGGTRIVVGDAASSSWQLQPRGDGDKAEDANGIQAADVKLPTGAAAVKFDVDQKKIDFEVAGATPQELGDQFVTQMESREWKREGTGLISDDYVFITYSKGKAEVQIRARSAEKKATAMISGDGLLWTKPLPAPPVRISYGTWLQRHRYDATLDRLDQFLDEMHKIPQTDSDANPSR
jgi:WD40 repeat protein